MRDQLDARVVEAANDIVDELIELGHHDLAKAVRRASAAREGRVEAILDELNSMKNTVEAYSKGNQALIQGMSDGFPDADPRGHREYHEQVMEAFKQRKELRDAFISKGFIAFMLWLVVFFGKAVWVGIKDSLA